MYRLALYEEGKFSGYISGELGLSQAAAKYRGAMRLCTSCREDKDIAAFAFDRSGTNCAVAIVDEFDKPIRNAEIL